MKLIGTPFQIKVWEEITKIPKGKTKTYKEIAINIGHPNSARELLQMPVEEIPTLYLFLAIGLLDLMAK